MNNDEDLSFKILDIISEKGDGKVNEDTYGIASNHLWVIDGVTDKTEKKYYSEVSDAAFFANSFSKELQKVTEHSNTIENPKALILAMKELSHKLSKNEFYESEKIYQPSFTIAMISLIEKEICIDILSDCFVYLHTNSHQIMKLTDERIKRISTKTQQVRDYIIQNNIPIEKSKEMLYVQKMKNRLLMNQEEGYWVGTIDGVAFEHMFSYKENREFVDQVLICTDGFNNAFDEGVAFVKDIFNHDSSLRTIYDKMRKKEKQQLAIDAKKCDDATAILVQIKSI